MIIGDSIYNKHFRYMILEGIACGLNHPIEYIINYSRGIGLYYKDMPEMNEFISLVWKEVYSLFFGKEPKENEIQDWINKYYEKGVKGEIK